MAKTSVKRRPLVGLIMGSQSDWATMRHAAETLQALGIACESRIVSAHRTPRRLVAYASGAKARGLRVIIAGAGGAAHLPGMAAAMTPLPVLGVPVESAALKGMDSLLSIVQMPAGIPVGTLAIGRSGAVNMPCEVRFAVPTVTGLAGFPFQLRPPPQFRHLRACLSRPSSMITTLTFCPHSTSALSASALIVRRASLRRPNMTEPARLGHQ